MGCHGYGEGGPHGEGPAEKEKRCDGDERTDSRCEPRQPSLSYRCRVGLADLQFLSDFFVQRAIGVLHDIVGHLFRVLSLHALRLVKQGQLFFLHFRHQLDLVALNCDLVGIDLPLALRGEVARRTHG